MLISKTAPDFTATTVMPDNSFKEITLSQYKGKKVGSMGTIGCFSFFPTKNLSCIGDGGLATTNSKTIENKIRSLGEYGWDKKRNAQNIGINSRLDELQAAILNVKLKYLDDDNMERRKIASLYRSSINNSKIVQKYIYHSHFCWFWCMWKLSIKM